MWTILYQSLLRLATPGLKMYLWLRRCRGKEDKARMGERFGRPSRDRGAAPLVWFHAASVGEAQSLLSLISRLCDDHPSIDVMVTTGTVTSAKLMAARLPGRAFHQYMPVDHPAWTERFLNHWRPDLVIWSESEFWPGMLRGIRKRHIPALLLNARMSEKSFRNWQLAKPLIREMLGAFRLCLGQNREEVQRLLRLGARDAQISGNLKYAAHPLPVDEEKLRTFRNFIDTRQTLLWASTHPGEEEIALGLHQDLQKRFPRLLTIIVPRHPSRGGDIARLSEKAGFRAGLRSTGKLPREEEAIYIADTLGELGLFYRACRLCIIGGSFVPVGGHNPIEAGQLGCQIFYGPHMFNFVSICDDFESRKAAFRALNKDMLLEKILPGLQNPSHYAAMARAAEYWTAQQSHIVDDLAATLEPFMTPLAGPPAPRKETHA